MRKWQQTTGGGRVAQAKLNDFYGIGIAQIVMDIFVELHRKQTEYCLNCKQYKNIIKVIIKISCCSSWGSSGPLA